MIISDLNPLFDSRKSFYGKAKVLNHQDGTFELMSYNTLVARCVNGKVSRIPWCVNGKTSSPTTNRHIREFEKQYAF